MRMAAMLTLVQVVSASPASAQPPVTFYEAIDAGGDSFDDLNDSTFVGWDWNDRITTVVVPVNTTVTLYQHSDYGGQVLALGTGFFNLTDFSGPGLGDTWNDAVSSYRILTGNTPPPTKITILVNGSFHPSYIPWWMQYGSPMNGAVTATLGVIPTSFHWYESEFPDIITPNYWGIDSGGFRLGQFLDQTYQPVPLDIVAHSHGGNVAIQGTWRSGRLVRRLYQLGTPVNYDLWRSTPARVAARCQVSSTNDFIQPMGASSAQGWNIAAASYNAAASMYFAAEALWAGDYGGYIYYTALAAIYIAEADEAIYSTRLEVSPAVNLLYNSASHEDLHEPQYWNQAVNHCGLP